MNLLCLLSPCCKDASEYWREEKSAEKKLWQANHLALFTSPLPTGTWLCSKVSCSRSQAEPLENVSLLDPLETSKQDSMPPL